MAGMIKMTSWNTERLSTKTDTRGQIHPYQCKTRGSETLQATRRTCEKGNGVGGNEVKNTIVRQCHRTGALRVPLTPGSTRRRSVKADGRGKRVQRNASNFDLWIEHGRVKAHIYAEAPTCLKLKSTVIIRQK